MHKKLIAALIGLTLFIGGGTAGAEEKPINSQTKETQATTYPPYPDVWDWYEPVIMVFPFSLYLMPNGDALTEYHKESGKDKKLKTYAALFFEKNKFARKDAERILLNAKKYLRKLKEEKGEERFDYLKYAAVSPDGTWTITWTIPYNLNCYAGPNRYPFVLTNTKTGEKRIFTIFRLLDKPESFYVHGLFGQRGTKDEEKEFPNATCPGEARRTFKYQVDSVSGNFLFLNDNTFLFQVEWRGKDVNGTGLVLRFDSDLKSRSSIIGDYMFLIENKGLPGVMNELTGKEYEDDVPGEVETKDLYDYLMSIKK